MNSQNQKSGENSTNLQAAGNIIVNNGLSYNDAKQIALDIFKSNFIQLVGAAQKIAQNRGAEITDDFLTKLQNENPAGIAQAEDPDFQHALFTVQKEYARTGDKELGDLLIDLLIDRSKQEQRNIMQIVLNESLTTAPKLTNDQLANLAIIFLFRYSKNTMVSNHERLGAYFDKFVFPFIDGLNNRNSSYQHLEFSGCGKIEMGVRTLESILIEFYPGLFLKGLDSKQYENAFSIGLNPPFFIPCLNDPTKLQVGFIDNETMEKFFEEKSVSSDDTGKIRQLFEQNKMNDFEVHQLCISIKPYMEKVFDVWNKSSMKSFTLTSVGMAIGHANIKRLTGEFGNLSIWIN